MAHWQRTPPDQTTSAFSELVRELSRVGEETQELTNLVRDRLEEQWFQGHSEIFPLLSLWKEQIGATFFSTFHVARSALQYVPLLSDAASPGFPESPMEQAQCMDTTFGPGMAHLSCVAVAGQDMHCDFRNGSLCFPIVLFERTCGLVLARVPELTVEKYEHLASETANLHDVMRRSIFQRYAPEAPWLARAS